MQIIGSVNGEYCSYVVIEREHTDPNRMKTELRKMFGANMILWRVEPTLVPSEKMFDGPDSPAYCRARFSCPVFEGMALNEPATVAIEDSIGIGSTLYPPVEYPEGETEQTKHFLGDGDPGVEGAPA